MNRLIIILTLNLLFIGYSYGQADTISLRGASFEQEPHIGGHNNMNVKNWFDCGVINFPMDTPPDIHPLDFWGVTKAAQDSFTYLGLVVRADDSYESLSQKLSYSLIKGETYSISVYLSKSKRYISPSKIDSSFKKVNYQEPTVFRIWGGSGYCDDRELLGVTDPIDHYEWKKYDLELNPTRNINSITIEAFYKIPVMFPYNGHILVDNLSDIIKITNKSSSDFNSIQDKEPKDNLPPHLRLKKK